MSNTLILNNFQRKNGGWILTLHDSYIEAWTHSDSSYRDWESFLEEFGNDMLIQNGEGSYPLNVVMEEYGGTRVEIYIEEELVWEGVAI